MLLQSAVSFEPPLADFSLRVEQSDIVEHMVRILKMMVEYCIAKNKGPLLECSKRLKRALESRIWDQHTSVLCELPQLNDSSRRVLALEGPKTISELDAASAQSLQIKCRCSSNEATLLLRFARKVSAQVIEAVMTTTSSGIEFQLTPKCPSEGNAAAGDISYDLIAYDSASGTLLCVRTLQWSASPQLIQVPLAGYSGGPISACLLGQYAVHDIDLTPRTTRAPAPLQVHHEGQASSAIASTARKSAAKGKAATEPKKAKLSVAGNRGDRAEAESKIGEDFGVYRYQSETQQSLVAVPINPELVRMRRKANETGSYSVSVKRLNIRQYDVNTDYSQLPATAVPLVPVAMKEVPAPAVQASSFFNSSHKLVPPSALPAHSVPGPLPATINAVEAPIHVPAAPFASTEVVGKVQSSNSDVKARPADVSFSKIFF